jgi:hypothetical protein
MSARMPSRDASPDKWEDFDALVASMEELQIGKVFDLARRLKPGLTLEDMRNPHDFPELEDTDWHYEDGILTGIQSVRSAIRARMIEEQRRAAPGNGDGGDGEREEPT